MNVRKPGIVAACVLLPLVAGCKRSGDISLEGGVGITAVRSVCPEVGIPAGTGDITMFNPADSHQASAIDVVGVITNVRDDCGESGDEVVTRINFDIDATRRDTNGARDVDFPYFTTVVRGGSAVIAKRVGHATVHFADGQARATTAAQGTTVIDKAAATLPDSAREKITQKREAGDQTAAIDPLSDPDIRQAVLNASFEGLVGFQLTSDQLKYNLTR